MRRASITNKMALYFVSLSFTVVGVLGIISYLQTKDALFERTYNQLNTIKSVKKRQLTKFFDERAADVSYLAAMIESDFSMKDRAENHLLMNRIKQFLDYNRVYNFAIITGKYTESTIFISAGNSDIAPKKNKKYFVQRLKAANGMFYEILDNNHSIEYYLLASIKIEPVNKTGSIDIQLSIDPKRINDIMHEQSPEDGFGNSVESFITGQDKLLRTKSRFIENSVLKIKADTKGFEMAANSGDGNSQYKDYRDIDVLGAYGRFQYSGLNWYIFAEIDFEEAYKPIKGMLNNMLLYTLGISVILFLFTYYLSKRFMVPIKSLTEASGILSSGSYPMPVTVENDDELGILGDTFNKMMERLKSQEQELEYERLKRASAAIDSTEAERKRLSRELHDGLGQAMTAIKLKLESFDPENGKVSEKLIKGIKTDIDGTIEEIRNISNGLMPAVLIEFGIVNALRNLCEEFNEHSSINIDFSQNYKARLSIKEETYLYRIAQEALKNIIIHSGANRASIELISETYSTILSIKDNGKGFDENKIVYGNGIFNMKERVKIINGEIIISSGEGIGTNINIKIKNSEN